MKLFQLSSKPVVIRTQAPEPVSGLLRPGCPSLVLVGRGQEAEAGALEPSGRPADTANTIAEWRV